MSHCEQEYAKNKRELLRYTLNGFDSKDQAFRWACANGYTTLIEIFLENYTDLTIELNYLFGVCKNHDIVTFRNLLDAFPNFDIYVNLQDLFNCVLEFDFTDIFDYFKDSMHLLDTYKLLYEARIHMYYKNVYWLLNNCVFDLTKLDIQRLFIGTIEDAEILNILATKYPDYDIHANDFQLFRMARQDMYQKLVELTAGSDIEYHVLENVYCYENVTYKYIISKNILETDVFKKHVFDEDSYIYMHKNSFRPNEMILNAKCSKLKALCLDKKSARKI